MAKVNIFRHNANIESFDIRDIDLNACETREQIFNVFKLVLEFGDEFGNNWNAFHDNILNLFFTVENGLKLIIRHGEAILRLPSIEQSYIISDLVSMACGNATQDDGASIDVCLQIEFDCEANANKFTEIIFTNLAAKDLIVTSR